ncbi:hypothetical protein ACP70R_036485 [Stipagrostis hirtigluma subsp. patula]
MATSCHAPAKRCISRESSGNPLPRRGQVKEQIVKKIAAAVATVAVLACDKTAAGTGKERGGIKAPAAEAVAKKN